MTLLFRSPVPNIKGIQELLTFPHDFPVYPNYNLFGPSLHDNIHHLLIICHPFMGIIDCCPSPITVTLPGSNKTSNTKDLIGWLSKNIRLCHSQNHVTKLCNDVVPEKWISPKARRIRFRWWPGIHTRYSLVYLPYMSIYTANKTNLAPDVPAKVKLRIGGSLSDSRFETTCLSCRSLYFLSSFLHDVGHAAQRFCDFVSQLTRRLWSEWSGATEETMLQPLMNQQYLRPKKGNNFDCKSVASPLILRVASCLFVWRRMGIRYAQRSYGPVYIHGHIWCTLG